MNIYQPKKADVFLEKENMVHIRIHPKVHLDREDMLEINTTKFKMVGEKKYTVLFVPGKQATISKEAREISSFPVITRNAIAKAIVVKTLAHRLIGNFFIKTQKPAHKTKLFDSEEKAIEWLDKMMENKN